MKQFNTLKITVLLLVFSSTRILKAQIPFDGKIGAYLTSLKEI